MFDDYEPVPAIPCPTCGQPLQWQGKWGPNALFVWRQGERHPVDQPIDEDVRLDQERFADFELPATFVISGWCDRDHHCFGIGRCRDGQWTDLEVTTRSEAEIDEQMRRERAGD